MYASVNFDKNVVLGFNCDHNLFVDHILFY